MQVLPCRMSLVVPVAPYRNSPNDGQGEQGWLIHRTGGSPVGAPGQGIPSVDSRSVAPPSVGGSGSGWLRIRRVLVRSGENAEQHAIYGVPLMA